MNKIPAKTIKQFYKRFANGEQCLYISSITGEILNQEKRYYWQEFRIYNMIKPLLAVYGKDLTESKLYGKGGLVSLLEPWQRAYNSIMNKHEVHIEFATFGYIAAEDGSIDVDELGEEGLAPGKILVYRQGANRPQLEKDALNPQAYIESADYCYKQMINICKMFLAKNTEDLYESK